MGWVTNLWHTLREGKPMFRSHGKDRVTPGQKSQVRKMLLEHKECRALLLCRIYFSVSIQCRTNSSLDVEERPRSKFKLQQTQITQVQTQYACYIKLNK